MSLAKTLRWLLITVLAVIAGFTIVTLSTWSSVVPASADDFPPSEAWLKAHEDNNDSDTIRIRCPYRDQCLPPGTCKRDEQLKLQDKKNEACGKPRACSLPRPPRDPQKVQDSEKVDCRVFEDYVGNGGQCIDRRADVMSTCFRGGDPRHDDEIEKVERNVNECKQALAFAKGQNICR